MSESFYAYLRNGLGVCLGIAGDRSSTEPSAASSADVDVAINLASSPAVRAQSGELLGAIQAAATRWRHAMAKKWSRSGGSQLREPRVSAAAAEQVKIHQ
eukprot:gene13921-15606_t